VRDLLAVSAYSEAPPLITFRGAFWSAGAEAIIVEALSRNSFAKLVKQNTLHLIAYELNPRSPRHGGQFVLFRNYR